MKPTWDYTDLAVTYDKRPGYAPDAIDALLKAAGVGAKQRVADLGAGTAKLTRPLLERGLVVDAVEPNAAMRAHGIKNTEGQSVTWHEAMGEATGLPTGVFDLVTFGSSFNVTDRPAALIETVRLLKPKAWFACLWNHRDLDDPQQKAIEALIHARVPDYGYGSRRENQTPVINESGLFGPVQTIEGRVEHTISVADHVAAWRSHGTLQRQAGDAFDGVVAAIAELLAGQETITIPYTTRVFCAPAAT